MEPCPLPGRGLGHMHSCSPHLGLLQAKAFCLPPSICCCMQESLEGAAKAVVEPCPLPGRDVLSWALLQLCTNVSSQSCVSCCSCVQESLEGAAKAVVEPCALPGMDVWSWALLQLARTLCPPCKDAFWAAEHWSWQMQVSFLYVTRSCVPVA